LTRFATFGESATRNLLPPAVTLALILAGWEAYSRLVLDAIPGGSRLLPAPTAVVAALVTNANDLAVNTWQTVLETVIGLALALLVGFGFAVCIDLSPLARRAIYPLLVVSQTIPLLALAPLLVLWFGFGILPKILVVALVCFFPIVVAGVDGFRSTDPELIRLFRTFGAGKWTIFTRVRLPGSLPSLFSGIRIAVTYCVIGAVWGEYVGAQYGLGIFMQSKQHAFDVATVFACVVVISAISFALFLLTSLIERAVIPWYYRSSDRNSNQNLVP
jgi:ABC-type nitrate/sulfonate/bicarbonate transport system permease component